MKSLVKWYARGTDSDDYRVLTTPVRGRVRAAAALQCFSVGCAFAAIYFLWSAVCFFVEPERAGFGLWMSIVVSGVSAAVSSILMFGAYGISHFADVRAQSEIRADIVDALGSVPMSWFISGSGGKTIDVVASRVSDIHAALAHGRLEIIYGAGLPIAGFAWLLILDWRLALVSVVPGLVVMIQAQLTAEALDAERAVGLGKRADLIDAALEYVKDPSITRAHLHAREEGGEIVSLAKELEFIYHRVINTQPPLSRWVQHLSDSFAILMLTVLLGGWMSLQGWLGIPELLAFVIVSVALAGGIAQLQFARWALSNSYKAATEIADLLESPRITGSGAADNDWVLGAAAVEFDSVSFGYGDSVSAVDRISFSADVGTVTAIVGASGAGKSTIVSLLARFFDVSSGSIRVNGVDVDDLSTDELYRRVGFVLQRPGLVTASVADNLRLGNPSASVSHMHEAARKACIHDRIMELPNGYDSLIGTEVALSGGEAQRISLARTMINDPSILVLDEPTANVDSESEAELNAAIRAAMSGKTVIVVSHRLRTLVDSDQILVLDAGRIVDAGTHDELMTTSHLYRMQCAELDGDDAPIGCEERAGDADAVQVSS